jgi:hypothetical protein
MKLTAHFLAGVAAGGGLSLLGADHILRLDFEPDSQVINLSLAPNASSYYTLLLSPDLRVFPPLAMALGADGAQWKYSVRPDPVPGFFEVLAQSVFTPGDSDGDGIDDVYELQHSDRLDPFNHVDAGQPSGVGGLTNYQKYLRDLLLAWTSPLQFTSQEVSLFNHGAPTARLEAIGTPVTVYNALPGSGAPTSDIDNTYSTEVSLFNLGSPSARLEAIGLEATVYNFGSP